MIVALHPEGVDRNAKAYEDAYMMKVSPSTRRAWIEMGSPVQSNMDAERSPSTRRAWIEIPLI